jgi:hypothetical protein
MDELMRPSKALIRTNIIDIRPKINANKVGPVITQLFFLKMQITFWNKNNSSLSSKKNDRAIVIKLQIKSINLKRKKAEIALVEIDKLFKRISRRTPGNEYGESII